MELDYLSENCRSSERSSRCIASEQQRISQREIAPAYRRPESQPRHTAASLRHAGHMTWARWEQACRQDLQPTVEVQRPPTPAERPPLIHKHVLGARRWWKVHICPILTSVGAVGPVGTVETVGTVGIVETVGTILHDPRDFHALERTYLAYTRTANALSLFAVLITQLFVISDVSNSVGIAFASMVYCAAILTTVLSCARFFRQQRLMIRGRAAGAGGDVMLIWVAIVAICLGLFVAILVV